MLWTQGSSEGAAGKKTQRDRRDQLQEPQERISWVRLHRYEVKGGRRRNSPPRQMNPANWKVDRVGSPSNHMHKLPSSASPALRYSVPSRPFLGMGWGGGADKCGASHVLSREVGIRFSLSSGSRDRAVPGCLCGHPATSFPGLPGCRKVCAWGMVMGVLEAVGRRGGKFSHWCQSTQRWNWWKNEGDGRALQIT